MERSEIETEEDLRRFIGIEERELLNSNNGAIDILSVSDGKVRLGWLASGHQKEFTIDEFLKNGGF